MAAKAHTVFLVGDTQRDHAKRLIEAAPDDHVMKLAQVTRTDLQNRKLWPMLKDVQDQVPSMAVYSTEDIKLRFLNALGAEMRFLPELEGAGMFPVGLRSSTLSKAQFAALIELIYAFGAKHDVQWSDPQEVFTA